MWYNAANSGFRFVGRHGPVADILSEKDAGALLRSLYRTLQAARQTGLTVHLSVTGGRKTMAIYAMVAAQLLFGKRDRAWHMISLARWSEGEKSMHAGPGESRAMRYWLRAALGGLRQD